MIQFGNTAVVVNTGVMENENVIHTGCRTIEEKFSRGEVA